MILIMIHYRYCLEYCSEYCLEYCLEYCVGPQLIIIHIPVDTYIMLLHVYSLYNYTNVLMYYALY